jgi:UDP-N-acetylglucosamine--N-acetylmuramyl-(pentapeptide) pyrophosphoryl-undecaprenol N-acetylglucosamine transferase
VDGLDQDRDQKGAAFHGNVGAHRVIMAGGGTGGHIFPAIAIANALKQLEPGIEILFVGARGKMEMEKVPEAGYKIVGLDIAGFNRSSLIKNIGLPLKLLKSFFQVRKIMKEFKPQAAIGVGGYSSFPVLRWAQQNGIPSFIHESNSLAGKSNILLGKRAIRIFVAARGMNKFFPEDKILFTGNPIRAGIANIRPGREEGLRFFGLDPALKTVLALGGSLGAKSINEAIAAHIEEFGLNNLQLIWQTGRMFSEKAKQLSSSKKNIWTGSFITKMEYAFAAADLVISRAGAMAIAELCVVKKPVVFVPYPFAAEDHQTVNAQYLVQQNAGLMVRDEEAREKLVKTVTDLAEDENRQNELKKNIGALSITDADKKIATEVMKVLNTMH